MINIAGVHTNSFIEQEDEKQPTASMARLLPLAGFAGTWWDWNLLPKLETVLEFLASNVDGNTDLRRHASSDLPR